MVAAKFDAKKDLELQSAPGPSRKLIVCKLPKGMSVTTIKSVFIFVLILLLVVAGLNIFCLAGMITLAWSKNYQAFQIIEFGPNGPVKMGKGCGGIINVKMNGTTQLQLTYMIQRPAVVSCTWVIQSDAKMVNLTWTNGRNDTTQNGDELLVGELIHNELHNCRNIGEANRTTTIIGTPSILQIQPLADSQATLDSQTTLLAYSDISLTPIASAGAHQNEPGTYSYNSVNPEPRVSAISNDGPPGTVTILESDNIPQLVCSSDNEGGEQCCKSVRAYRFNSTNDASSSCTAVSMSSDHLSIRESVLLLLASSHGKAHGPDCQVKWEKSYFKAI